MNRFKAAAVVLAMVGLVIASAGAQRADQAQAMFEAARQTETLEGDLASAIRQYQAIVDSYSKTDRLVAATALVRMAECHQKLGDAQARTIYERLVREFGDQREAVTIARARLGVAGPATLAKTKRAVWTGPYVDPFGQVSPDGRSITFVDWTRSSNLMVHEVASNTDRALTSNLPWANNPSWVWTGSAEWSAISKDGRQVAYAWNYAQGRYDLYVAALQGTGLPQPRKLIAGTEELERIIPYDWSPDGRWIAIELQRKDQSRQIALVAAVDGSLRVLKSMDWRGPKRIFVSPDGKYVAYDRPVSDTGEQYDVFVLAIDGSREIPAVVHPAEDNLMGWSPDGHRLLFTSDRTGPVSLWALPVAEGKPQGTPELLEPDLGPSESLGLTAAGALYVFRHFNSRDIKIAPIDVEAGKLLGPPVSFTQGFIEDARNPDWSPDGKFLAYQACEEGGCIAIRSVATGQVRKLPRTMRYPTDPRWSPDGRWLLTRGKDLRGRNGIFQIDAQTGDATPVILGDGLFGAPQWSPDGKKIYYNRRPVFVERDLASGAEREVTRGLAGPLSPDGRYFVASRNDQSTLSSSLLLVPIAGGQPRELHRLPQIDAFGSGRTLWTRDGSAVIARSLTELWLVPITGDRPRKLDIDVEDSQVSLSPDGHHIAFLSGKRAFEVWALENFLPALTAKK